MMWSSLLILCFGICLFTRSFGIIVAGACVASLLLPFCCTACCNSSSNKTIHCTAPAFDRTLYIWFVSFSLFFLHSKSFSSTFHLFAFFSLSFGIRMLFYFIFFFVCSVNNSISFHVCAFVHGAMA